PPGQSPPGAGAPARRAAPPAPRPGRPRPPPPAGPPRPPPRGLFTERNAVRRAAGSAGTCPRRRPLPPRYGVAAARAVGGGGGARAPPGARGAWCSPGAAVGLLGEGGGGAVASDRVAAAVGFAVVARVECEVRSQAERYCVVECPRHRV